MASYVRRASKPRTSRRRSPGRELQAKNTARKASPAQKRAADKARIRAAQAKKRRGTTTTKASGRGSGRKPQGAKRSTAPKKDTRTRGGQGGAKGAIDQMAFQRFVRMTPEQQRHVMRMAPGEHRRRTR
jgi:hypothetical protein